MHKILKILTSRLFIVVPLVIAQLVFFVLLFREVAVGMQLEQFLSAASVILAILVINRWEDPSYRIGWLFIILGIPIIGIPLYILAGNRKVPAKLANGTIAANRQMVGLLENDPIVLGEGAKADPNIQNIFWYGYQASGFPIYEGTTCKYYPSGEAWLPDYIAELKKAKHFIFMEYFIIDKGSVWDEILAVLKQKAAEGVEVKVIYDDFGSITLPVNYDKKLKAMGIEAYRFNKVHPAFIIQMNNRDHRKITVIDNNVAFTGGVNLEDEYVNRINRFGYWKDSAIRLQGKAVWSMTVMFLGMYTFLTDKNKKIDYLKYKLPCDEVSDGGFYQPYSDTPTDSEAVALNMHLNMVTRARHYVFIDTPYLILTENMIQALIRAAKSGVDVRILTPHHPDKLLVFQITRGNYARLVENGVKIYEYTPGFNHAKNFVSDDSLAIVGSANTDYRSYFLHFENGVLMHNTPEIEKIRDNFLTSLLDARQVTRRDIEKELWIVKIIRAILNIFIPLV